MPELYDFEGSIPEVINFYDMLDNPSLVQMKNDFVEKRKNSLWVMKKELLKRSKFKTTTLAKACLLFLKENLNLQFFLKSSTVTSKPLTVIHAFTSTVLTLSALSYKIFRLYYLNQETVYTVQNEKVEKQINVSRGEYELACYLEKKLPNSGFMHAFSNAQGQKRFGRYFVDIYSPKSKTVYQYQGCHVHNHIVPDCKDPKRQHLTKETSISVYKKTYEKTEAEKKKFESYLRENQSDQVLNVQYIYECEFQAVKKSADYLEYLKYETRNLKRPLHRLVPRVAVRSGLLETYNIRWSKDENPNEIFCIADVNALYSHISLTHCFPVDKPITLMGEDINLIQIQNKQLFFKDEPLLSGMIFCSVLAPSNEMFPCLQYRVENKYNFLALCRTCSEKKMQSCKHNEMQAKFTSTWTLPDINKALRENYKLVEIFEVQYFPKRKPILKPYVQILCSERLKYSGLFKNVLTLEEKQKLCDEINLRLNLTGQFALNAQTLEDNPMKKKMYKDLLNFFFGKFSQHSNNSSTEIVYTFARLQELANKFEIIDMTSLTEGTVMVQYCDISQKPSLSTNINIGSEITSQARIFLHDYIKVLQECNAKIFAVDTDSIFYAINKDTVDPLPYSDCVGDFKAVIPMDCEILSYHSLGCRNYSILYRKPSGILETLIKVKGLSLNHSHFNHSLNVQTYADFIDSHFQAEYRSILIPQIRHRTDKKTLKKTGHLQKYEFRNDLFMKRYVDVKKQMYVTYPYGFK